MNATAVLVMLLSGFWSHFYARKLAQ